MTEKMEDAQENTSVLSKKNVFRVRKVSDKPTMSTRIEYTCGKREDFSFQRICSINHKNEKRSQWLMKMQNETQCPVDSYIHFLRLMVYESRRWRREFLKSKIFQRATQFENPNTQNILDTSDMIIYINVLYDIDVLMNDDNIVALKKQSIEYARIKSILSEKGLFKQKYCLV